MVDARAVYIKDRLITLNKTAADLIYESGALLKETKDNAIYKEWGFDSFDEAIETLHDRGELSFGARNARNLIAIYDMLASLGDGADGAKELGISKLREIASLKGAEAQRKLLEAARDMSVADVQKEAKRIRDKAAGRETDPIDPIIIKSATESQKKFYAECLAAARVEYSLNDEVPDAAVLVDHILADWHSGLQSIHAA